MSPDTETPQMASPSQTGNDGNMANSNAPAPPAPSEPSQTSPPTFPSKTDKPKPHLCTTCQRSFARLEHLKRHERSHTKEKPFACSECARAFARRDLLLRHQQKLHAQGAPTKPRNARRESTTGLPQNSGGRVRKNSVASINGGRGGPSQGMRPRANTISHPGALSGLFEQHNMQMGRAPAVQPGYARQFGHQGHSQHPSLSGSGTSGSIDYRHVATTTGVHGLPNGLSRLDTHLGYDMNGGLRTAPLPGMVSEEDAELEKFFGATVNPNQLHSFGGAVPNSATIFTNTNPFNSFTDSFAPNNQINDHDYHWGTDMNDPMMYPATANNDTAIDGSSPSAFSSASQSGYSEVMLDGSVQPAMPAMTSSAMWPNPLVSRSAIDPSSYSLHAMEPVFPELSVHPTSNVEFGDQGAPADYYNGSATQSSMRGSAGIPGMPNQYFHPSMGFQSDTGSMSSSSVNGSARHSSVTSVSTDTITDATRQALMNNLSQALGFGPSQRKYSQPQISSPLSAGANGKLPGQIASLPSTVDLQRYVNAYIQYFHPHLPFLHIPTLSFDTPAFTYHMRTAGNFNHDSMVGGGGCLILAMAAIGALYEFDTNVAKDLFDAAKKMILYYLDERRRAGLSAAVNGGNAANDSINKPPLWLVQAMLLNLIFGHNCGDRQAAEVASTHCAALVSLAKAAGLDKPTPPPTQESYGQTPATDAHGDVDMREDESPSELLQKTSLSDPNQEHAQWTQWKTAEERKRTYFAVFSMSSLLVSAYAHAPRILNSEIRLDLPCEEDLWSVDNAQAWVAMGGPMIAQTKGLSFNAAMTYLLEASMRQQSEPQTHNAYSPDFGGARNLDENSESEIRPSTFGCYVLINALHVYIWETRQRHNGRLWKTQETEAMHAQVEPALKAWQAAWHTNPRHSIVRPNPYGPLAGDCIPLLDLAYIRLFVNLVRSKELLWQRDFEGMAAELARGVDIVPQADGSPERLGDSTDSKPFFGNSPGGLTPPQDGDLPGLAVSNFQNIRSSKREKHLRKAAFYAADSLAMAEEVGSAYAEFPARELPNSAAMCTFDCAQILAEWVATVQDRVGRFVGVLGKNDIDFTAVPAIMLLEEEDIKLLDKIAGILLNADMKLASDIQGMGSSGVPMLGGLANLSHCGYGTKLLMVTAYMLERAAVWPVTRMMARALEAHANHINQRAEASVTAS